MTTKQIAAKIAALEATNPDATSPVAYELAHLRHEYRARMMGRRG